MRISDWSSDVCSSDLGMSELVAYIEALLERVRAEPGDDLASALVQARSGDEALNDAELVAICVNLLFGGHETTTNLIGNSVLALIRHPDQAAMLREQPDLINQAVEEQIGRASCRERVCQYV